MSSKTLIVLFFVCLSFFALYRIFAKPSKDSFNAPGKEFLSSKKVEDYFVEKLRMSEKEANEIRTKDGSDGKVVLRVTKNMTLEALISNLHYYGFIKDEKAFEYALIHTKDIKIGKENSIKVGKTGTIDINASYRISENMGAWQIADVLLNDPSYFDYDEYNYMFMP